MKWWTDRGETGETDKAQKRKELSLRFYGIPGCITHSATQGRLFLLMPVLSQPLFAFVGRDLMSLSFFTARHDKYFLLYNKV
jgi:hypothetical protein